MDLEAPGLHEKFGLPSAACQSSGILPIFSLDMPFTPSRALHEATRVREAGGGLIDLIVAGPTPGTIVYFERYLAVQWHEVRRNSAALQSRIEGLQLLASTNYDYMLIDSRTGLCDSSGIALALFDATVAGFATYSHEALDGLLNLTAVAPLRSDDDSLVLCIARIPTPAQSSRVLSRDSLEYTDKPLLVDNRNASQSVTSQVSALVELSGNRSHPIVLLGEDATATLNEVDFIARLLSSLYNSTEPLRHALMGYIRLLTALGCGDDIRRLVLALVARSRADLATRDVLSEIICDFTTEDWWLWAGETHPKALGPGLLYSALLAVHGSDHEAASRMLRCSWGDSDSSINLSMIIAFGDSKGWRVDWIASAVRGLVEVAARIELEDSKVDAIVSLAVEAERPQDALLLGERAYPALLDELLRFTGGRLIDSPDEHPILSPTILSALAPVLVWYASSPSSLDATLNALWIAARHPESRQRLAEAIHVAGSEHPLHQLLYGRGPAQVVALTVVGLRGRNSLERLDAIAQSLGIDLPTEPIYEVLPDPRRNRR